jgi:hypothetical protein
MYSAHLLDSDLAMPVNHQLVGIPTREQNAFVALVAITITIDLNLCVELQSFLEFCCKFFMVSRRKLFFALLSIPFAVSSMKS